MSALRPLLALALFCFAVLSAAAAAPAEAEEAIVLDNGAVLRGTEIRADSSVVVFRLSGLGTDSAIEIRRDRIVRRFSTESSGLYDAAQYPGGSRSASSSPREGSGAAHAPAAVPAVKASPSADLPEEEPQAHEEGFVKRLVRLAVVAFPRDPESRLFLAGLAFVVLLCLVGLGGRMADVEGMTLARSTVLAVALGGLITMDALWYETFLRADRATWVVPAELACWIGIAALTMRCGVGRAVLLLAFVVFSGFLVTFASGGVLVAV